MGRYRPAKASVPTYCKLQQHPQSAGSERVEAFGGGAVKSLWDKGLDRRHNLDQRLPYKRLHRLVAASL